MGFFSGRGSLLGLVILFAVGVWGCSGDEEGAEVSVQVNREDGGDSLVDRVSNSGEMFSLPSGYELRAEANGDLDEDGRPEKVLVVDADRTGELGREREVMVFRMVDGAWILWYSAVGPVLPEEQGGTMGDPFALVRLS